MIDKIQFPVAGRYTITFAFGMEPAWYTRQFGEPHNGIDIAVPEGTPIVACDAGKVYFVDDTNNVDGLGVILYHVWGRSMYWHTKDNIAKYGTYYHKGDL